MPITLILRLPLGRAMTPAEMDQNLQKIQDAINGFESELAVALNPDGTLKTNSVSTLAIQNRAVTLAKLAFDAHFYAEDTGVANAMAIAFVPPAAGYVKGMVFFVKAIADNSGAACTLAVDALTPAAVKVMTSAGLSDPGNGMIRAAGIYTFVFDGTQFLLLNPTPINPGTVKTFTSTNTLNTDMGTLVSFSHLMAAIPVSVMWTLVCQAGGDSGFNENDELDVTGVWVEGTAITDYEPLLTPMHNTNLLTASVEVPVEGGGNTSQVIARQGAGNEAILTQTKWKLRVRALFYS